ncbi:MAG: hypothetical protein GY793_01045 [Proteobacteria bacterium]|nr:hypothetical protein [Pseudomonadota bacterium]
MVTVLNCLGFETDSSCGGHLKNSLFFPWVVVMKEDEKVKDYHDQNLKMQLRVIEFLEDFYFDRTTPIRHRLIVNTIPGCGTELMPQSGYISKLIQDKLERKHILEIYQQEIKDFTSFLKNKLHNR